MAPWSAAMSKSGGLMNPPLLPGPTGPTCQWDIFKMGTSSIDIHRYIILTFHRLHKCKNNATQMGIFRCEVCIGKNWQRPENQTSGDIMGKYGQGAGPFQLFQLELATTRFSSWLQQPVACLTSDSPSSSNEPLKYLICSWHLQHGMFYVLWNSCQMRCQQS